jgi:hypothetical protein
VSSAEQADVTLSSIPFATDVGAVNVLETVTPDGHRRYWVKAPGPDVPVNVCPPHERIGRLPWEWEARIRDVPRCGHPTATTGLPCRNEVRAPGTLCTAHVRMRARWEAVRLASDVLGAERLDGPGGRP